MYSSSAGHNKTYVQDGTNTTTGGTVDAPTVDVISNPSFQQITVNNQISGGTFYSGATELSTLFGDPSPLTTKGDLYSYDTADTRLPIGGDGYVLTPNSAAGIGMSWIKMGHGSLFTNNISDVGITLVAGLEGQYLTVNSATTSGLEWVNGLSSSGMTELLDDLSPQLGGNLDVNTREIISIGGNNINLHSDQHIIAELGGSGQTSYFQIQDNVGTPSVRIYDDGNASYFGGLSVTGNITVTGTVDGRDVATDGAALDLKADTSGDTIVDHGER